jgi:multidrug transporter EmrE-like cation transporter
LPGGAMENNLLLGIGLVILDTLIGSVGALFFKYASKHVHKNFLTLFKEPSLYVGVFFYGLSIPVFVFALKFGDLSTLYPVVGLSYVWISLLSIKFLKEKMNDIKWFGILLILVGVGLIGLSG